MNDTIKNAAERITWLVKVITPLLEKIPENEFSHKPTPRKWSKKQIIGHLIDSAANNHHRFIRSRIEDVPTIFYNQDEWNNLSHYNEMKPENVIKLWAYYNTFIAHLVSNIPENELVKKCRSGSEKEYTLEFLISDYVDHMEHHLKQVVQYN